MSKTSGATPEGPGEEEALRVGNLLRHAAEIEHCLEEVGAEKMTLGGPMPEVMQIGGHFFADEVYVIADDGRIERIEGADYEQELIELLPEDADAVIAVYYPIFSAGDVTLYTVAGRYAPSNPGHGGEAATGC